MGKKNYYAVQKGYKIGIFKNWPECQEAVNGYKGAVYKGFLTLAEAQKWLNNENVITAGQETAHYTNATDPTDSLNGIDFEVYTDGSYSNGKYSYGYAFIKDGQVIYESNGVGDDPEAAKMRNVAGEIAAVRHAVERAKLLNVRICIIHDYSGISQWVSGEWQAKNKFTQAYVAFMREHIGLFKFKKVTGHSGDRFNDYVDRLAKEALGLEV